MESSSVENNDVSITENITLVTVVIEEPVPVVEESTPVVEEPTPVIEPVLIETKPEPIPILIFIIPYRDREQHRIFFHNHMVNNILADIPKEDYKIWYIHQTDKREFNRGAMKNIGFLIAKTEYPNDYKNITLVFNDVDTICLLYTSDAADE